MGNKIYKIGGVDCKFKADLSLDESDSVNFFMNKFEVIDKNVIKGNLTNSEIKDLFSLILEPVNPKDSVNFGAVKTNDAPVIIADFFLIIIERGMNSEINSIALSQDLVKRVQSLKV